MRLFEPFALPQSGLRLKNRLVMAPMPTFGACMDGSVGEAELAYYRRRAEGGVAAIVTAGCAVAEDGLAHAGQWRCDDDRFTDSLSRCATAIREAGAQAILQLEHAGGAHLLNEREAPRLLRCFRESARRARQAGFSGVALHGAHGELLQQLFSKRVNASRWRFGGETVRERSRFPQQAVLDVCDAFQGPCWYRLPAEEEEPDGVALEQTLELAAWLVESGAEALEEIGAKRYETGSLHEPASSRPCAAVLAERLQEAPAAVTAVGGLARPEQVKRALSDGCDLIGLGRVLLSEPDWPQKVAAGVDGSLDFDLGDRTKLEALDVPPTVIDYLRRRAADRR